jgi:hypothetical protein
MGARAELLPLMRAGSPENILAHAQIGHLLKLTLQGRSAAKTEVSEMGRFQLLHRRCCISKPRVSRFGATLGELVEIKLLLH